MLVHKFRTYLTIVANRCKLDNMDKKIKQNTNSVCNICPRKCGVNRTKTKGFCGADDNVKISKVMLHHFEEPCISGLENGVGSGAIFFAGCNLKCVFCQNYEISYFGKGKIYSIAKLVETIKNLERMGAYNINLVTPTHFTEQILKALKIYKPKIPVVWNSGGYESVETIKKLEGFVDIYLVDLKYASNELAKRYSKADNYVQNNQAVIKEMVRQQSKNIYENGLMKKGVIIRHLVLPTHSSDSLKCLDFVANEIGKSACVSLMSQYEPVFNAKDYPEINRKITPIEYKRVVNHALKLNLMNCYTQDLSSADCKKYTPKF